MDVLRKTIDLILPPRCIVSGEIVDAQGVLSPSAWTSLNFISDPCCRSCGIPFDFGVEGSGSLCAACLKEPPVFDRARAALVYDDASRDIILGFKHGDQTHAVPAFVPWLKSAGAELLADADYLVPVPLHRWRMFRRRFNQSALMAKALARETKKSTLLDLLIRRRATPSQGHLKAKDRKKNVRGAFILNPKFLETIQGKKIVLIDDVFTTGSTVGECASVLKKAGASSVSVLALARVVRPVHLD